MDPKYNSSFNPGTHNQGFWDGAKGVQSSSPTPENLMEDIPESSYNGDFSSFNITAMDDEFLNVLNCQNGDFTEDPLADFNLLQGSEGIFPEKSPDHEPNLYFADNQHFLDDLSTIDDLDLDFSSQNMFNFDHNPKPNVTIKTKKVKASKLKPIIKPEIPTSPLITISEERLDDSHRVLTINEEETSKKLIDHIENDNLIRNFLSKICDSGSESDISVGYSPASSPSHSSPSSPELPSTSMCGRNFDENSESESNFGAIRKKRGRTRRGADEFSSPGYKMDKKKEQNKSAAQRYRQKKKKEEIELATKVADLEEEQKNLKKKYKHMRTEVRAAKKFLREAFIAKGLLSSGLILKI